MFDDSYLCEMNIEVAKNILDREWEKSKQIQNIGGRALYLGFACFHASNALIYWEIFFLTHGGY